MLNNLRFYLPLATFVVLTTNLAWGQQSLSGKLYDQGVNAYFAGRYSEAEAALSESLADNSQDPRTYYFRALSLLRQGRIEEARGDMFTGALLEAQSPRRFAVGSALQRVQGSDRLMLEKCRRDARHDAVVQTSAVAPGSAIVTPPPTFQRPEPDAAVLRHRQVVPLEELLRPDGPRVSAGELAPLVAPLPPQASPGKPATAANTIPSPPVAPGSRVAAPPPAPANNPFEDDSQKAPAKVGPPPSPANLPATSPQATPSHPVPPSKAGAPSPGEVEDNPFGG